MGKAFGRTSLTKYHLQNTFEGVFKAIKSIETGKSPGNDHNATAEALKHRGDQLIEYLRQIFTIVLNHQKKHQRNDKKLASYQFPKNYQKT